MRDIRSNSGLTIVELIIAGFVLTVILGIVGAYLGRQSQLNRVTMAASEVQDKTRLVMQMVVQDLQLAGGKFYVDASGEVDKDAGIPSCPSHSSGGTACLTADDGGPRDGFSTVYVNTLRSPGDACREVGYEFVDTLLYRADRSCGTTVDLLDPAVDFADYSILAENIVALDIQYKCSDSSAMTTYPNEADCPLRAGYLRSAVVSVVARANNPTDGTSSESFSTVTGESVTCPQNYRCFAIQQEVLMPNFKDR